jgi:hypothetical protein
MDMIPKSTIEYYDGTDVYLDIPRNLLTSFDSNRGAMM